MSNFKTKKHKIVTERPIEKQSILPLEDVDTSIVGLISRGVVSSELQYSYDMPDISKLDGQTLHNYTKTITKQNEEIKKTVKNYLPLAKKKEVVINTSDLNTNAQI